MNRLRIALATFAMCACGHESVEEEDAALRHCAVGTWIHAEKACTCPVGFAFNTAECAEADCREASVLVLADDGSARNVFVRSSEHGGQLSAIGGDDAVATGSWSVHAGRLSQHSSSGAHYDTGVECDARQLIRPNAATYARLSDARAKAITSAIESGHWTTVLYRR